MDQNRSEHEIEVRLYKVNIKMKAILKTKVFNHKISSQTLHHTRMSVLLTLFS